MSPDERFGAPADTRAAWTRLLRRRWRTGGAALLAVLAAGAVLLLLSRPVYRSESALRLGEPPPAGGVSPNAGLLSFLQPGGDPFANDLELLGSRSLAEAVVERTALNASVRAPAGWHRDSLFTALEASRETDEAVFSVRWDADGRARVDRVAPEDSAVGVAAPGEVISFGGVRMVLRPRRPDGPEEFQIATVPFAEATRSTRSALRIERPRRDANVVVLAYDHADPGLAQEVVWAVVDGFVQLRTALHQRESAETVDSLRTVAGRTAEELRAAEDALERIQREGRIVAPDAQSEALVERQGELLQRVQRARSELAGVDETLRRLDAVSDPSRSWTALLSYPTFLENQTLGDLLGRLTGLHARREELAGRLTPENRELRLVEEEIAYLDSSLRQVAREYRAGLVEQIASIEPELAALDRELSGLPGRAVELARRQRDVRLLTEVLLLTEQRLRQEELRSALTYANVQVIDPPALLARPVWPRKRLGLAVVLVLATGTGLLGMVVREHTDPRIRDADDVERALGAPVLAVVGRERSGAITPEPEAALGLLRGADASGGRLVLLPAGEGGSAAAVVEALSGTSGNGEGPPVEERLRAAGPVRNAGDAAVIASEGRPAAVVVEAGRTTSEAARRTARLLRAAGGTVAGAVLVDRKANGGSP